MTARTQRKPDLALRFETHLANQGEVRAGDRIVVALSGGLDSTVLLHLARFALHAWGLHVQAAHFDHGLRPSSAADADWVAGLCRAWGVNLTRDVAPAAPNGEAEARTLRYAFLAEVQASISAQWVLTAHHADDQAETVLFRAARGSGLRGLRGILPVRDGWLLRPLLPFSRQLISAYASSVRLRWREDPTNADPKFRRNVIRHAVLPILEGEVASGAARSLARLAEHARAVDDVVEGLAEAALKAAIVHHESGQLVLDRPRLLEIPEAARAEVLRAAAKHFGVTLSHAGTRLAVEVSSPDFPRGGRDLGGGIHLSVQYEDLVMEVATRVTHSQPVSMSATGDGTGGAIVGGRVLDVSWSHATAGAVDLQSSINASFVPEALRFPLVLRAWRPGDRIQFTYGSKKVKQLFQEARLPRWRRARQPLLVDATDQVLWAPGLARSAVERPRSGAPAFRIAVEDNEPRSTGKPPTTL